MSVEFTQDSDAVQPFETGEMRFPKWEGGFGSHSLGGFGKLRENVAVLTLTSPAKINLFLAITGRRPDGFHDLVSVVAPITLADTLEISASEQWSLTCSAPEVPVDDRNLVLRAAKAFYQEAGLQGAAAFHLNKRIPIGAGLGGGSSNAVACLRGLNVLHRYPLDESVLARLAERLGSDCRLFLKNEPQIMRGRGERLETLPELARARLRGQRLLLFKPTFGIETAWAYKQMAARAPALYLPEGEAEARLAHWVGGPFGAAELLYNNMEIAAFEKYLALPVLLDWIRQELGWAVGMSGSGSACFALVPAGAPLERVVTKVRQSWGDHAFVAEAAIV